MLTKMASKGPDILFLLLEVSQSQRRWKMGFDTSDLLSVE